MNPERRSDQPAGIPDWFEDDRRAASMSRGTPGPAKASLAMGRLATISVVVVVVTLAVTAYVLGLRQGATTPSAAAASSREPAVVPAPTEEPLANVPLTATEAAPPQPSGSVATTGSDGSPDSSTTAVDALAALEVRGRAPVNDYDRDLFGQAWLDVDRNGCDTRNDILRRDLTDVVLKPGTNGCVVLAGTHLDPYSGRTSAFIRGADTSSDVQIDHVVALADAWQKGARQWSDDQRAEFANDPLNLLAVDGALNQQKGAGDAATWLPPDRSSWCSYGERIIAVKAQYAIWVTEAEKAALARLIKTCSDRSENAALGTGR